MSTTAVKSFWSGVREAAKDTPRMYIEGAKDIAGAVTRVFGAHRDLKPENIRTPPGADGYVIIERGRHGRMVVKSVNVKHQSTTSSALRVNKLIRAKKLAKKP